MESEVHSPKTEPCTSHRPLSFILHDFDSLPTVGQLLRLLEKKVFSLSRQFKDRVVKTKKKRNRKTGKLNTEGNSAY